MHTLSYTMFLCLFKHWKKKHPYISKKRLLALREQLMLIHSLMKTSNSKCMNESVKTKEVSSVKCEPGAVAACSTHWHESAVRLRQLLSTWLCCCPGQDNESPARDHKVFAEISPAARPRPASLRRLFLPAVTHMIGISQPTTRYYNVRGLCLPAAHMLQTTEEHSL